MKTKVMLVQGQTKAGLEKLPQVLEQTTTEIPWHCIWKAHTHTHTKTFPLGFSNTLEPSRGCHQGTSCSGTSHEAKHRLEQFEIHQHKA